MLRRSVWVGYEQLRFIVVKDVLSGEVQDVSCCAVLNACGLSPVRCRR